MKDLDIHIAASLFAGELGPYSAEIAYNSFIAGAKWALFTQEREKVNNVKIDENESEH